MFRIFKGTLQARTIFSVRCFFFITVTAQGHVLLFVFELLDHQKAANLEEVNDSFFDDEFLFFGVNDLEDLQECESVGLVLVVEVKDCSEELASLSNGKVALAIFIVLVIELHDICDSICPALRSALLYPTPIVVKDDSKEYINQEEPPKQQVDYEE